MARKITRESNPELRPLKIAVLSTFTAPMMAAPLVVEMAQAGFRAEFRFGPWGVLEQAAGDPEHEVFAGGVDAVVLFGLLRDFLPRAFAEFAAASAVQKEEWLLAIEARCLGLFRMIRSHSPARILVANFASLHGPQAGLADASADFSEATFLARANERLATAARAVAGVNILDFAGVVAREGARAVFDARLASMARMPFTPAGQAAIARRVARTVRAAFSSPIKVLALDLDNTLWGGILGEDGPGGIALGADYPGNVFLEFQTWLKALKQRGILLALASKNNEPEVRALFETHPDSVLRWADFSATRVNWNPKSQSLQEMAQELGLGLDSFAFFDDNPVERDEVRRFLPQVHVAEAPASPLQYLEALEESGLFDRLTITAEDAQRGEFYRQEQARRDVEATAGSREDFLRSLEMRAEVGLVGATTLPRVAQLSERTNQFNLTTRRRTAADISATLERGGFGLWLRLADRFGDHGLVGAALVEKEAGDTWVIDEFLLSCRVIGREAEQLLVRELGRAAEARGATRLVADFIPTAKNQPAAGFLSSAGFSQRADGRWERSLPVLLAGEPFIEVQAA